MALAGALLACSKALDRRVIGPAWISQLLYLLIVAESGAGKQSCHQLPADFVERNGRGGRDCWNWHCVGAVD